MSELFDTELPYIGSPPFPLFQLWLFPHFILILFPVLIALCHMRHWRFTTRDLLLFVLACAVLLGYTGPGLAGGLRVCGANRILRWWWEHCVLTGLGGLIASSLITIVCWHGVRWLSRSRRQALRPHIQ